MVNPLKERDFIAVEGLVRLAQKSALCIGGDVGVVVSVFSVVRSERGDVFLRGVGSLVEVRIL